MTGACGGGRREWDDGSASAPAPGAAGGSPTGQVPGGGSTLPMGSGGAVPAEGHLRSGGLLPRGRTGHSAGPGKPRGRERGSCGPSSGSGEGPPVEKSRRARCVADGELLRRARAPHPSRRGRKGVEVRDIARRSGRRRGWR